MTHAPLACLILAGGKGTRMKSEQPKLLHDLCGRSLLGWTLAAVAELAPDPRGCGRARGRERGRRVSARLGAPDRPGAAAGTGDAARSGRQALAGFAGDVLVLNGDHPLTDPASLRDLVAGHRAAGAAASVLTFDRTPGIGGDFGRVVRAADGSLQRIVEAADASDEERALTEVNSGIYVFDAGLLWPALDRLERRQRPGRAVPDRRRRGPPRRGTARRRPSPGRRHRRPGREHPCRPGRGGRDPPGADRPRAHAGRGDDRRSGHHLHRRICSIEPDVVVQPFTILQGDSLLERGCVVGPNAVVVDSRIGPRRRGRAVLPTAARGGARGGRPRRPFRRDQERPHRRGCKGASPVLYWGCRNRCPDQHRRGSDHRQLRRPTETAHRDRARRPHRERQCVRRPSDDRRWSVDGSWIDHHRRRAAGRAGSRPSPSKEHRGIWKAKAPLAPKHRFRSSPPWARAHR